MQDGKFHPHTEHKKGVRKSRDQEAKTQGIRFSRELKTLTESERKELFNKVNSIGVSVSKKQRKVIYDKLWEDNIKNAKNRLKGKEKFWLKTNTNMETFAFALNEDTGGIRTLAFIGHENKDNPEDVRRIPDVKLKNERKARDTLTVQEQRDKFGSEFREKGGDELTEEINRKWENVIVKSTMHKLSKGFAITALDDLIRNFRAFFDDTNWELIAKEKGQVGIIQEIRSIKKSSLLFTGERLKDRFGFGEPDPRPVDKAGKIVQQLFEPFEKMRDEQFGQIKEREADFLMARQIITDATDEIQGESKEQLIRGLKL